MDSSYYSHVRSEMLEFIPIGVREVLDIGCSGGYFGELLQQQRGCRVTGVEPCPEPFAIAKAKLHRAFLDSAESFLASYPEKFDLICFNDVLEHLFDPWTQLRACRRLLEPGGGLIVASVPNIWHYFALKDILVSQDFPYQEAGIFDRMHLRFFTKKSVQRMFFDCGYIVMRCQGINGLRSRRYTWSNRLTFRCFEDLLYPQFAIVAKATIEDPSQTARPVKSRAS